VISVDESARTVKIEQCRPVFRVADGEPFKPEVHVLSGVSTTVGGKPLVVDQELFVTKVYKRRRLIGFKVTPAKTTLRQELEASERRKLREIKRRAALPTMKYFRPTRSGFWYQTDVRPLTDEERTELYARDAVGVFVRVHLSYFKFSGNGRVTVSIEKTIKSEFGSWSSSDHMSRLEVCELDRIDHKLLTEFAMKLDDSLPEIARLCDAGDHDGASEIAKRSLGLNQRP